MSTTTTILHTLAAGVTADMIGKARKIIDPAGNYYKVQSKSCTGIERTVTYVKGRGLRCDCPAGLAGIRCWHIRAACAAELEAREAMQAQFEAQETQVIPAVPARECVIYIDGKLASDEDYARVMNAKPKRNSNAKLYSPKPFSLLR